jgi:hypothetical protein
MLFCRLQRITCDPLTPVGAVVGGNVKLDCRTHTAGNVSWMFLSNAGSKAVNIYKNGQIYDNYKDRFDVTAQADKLHTLNIDNVQPSDTGFYVCRETMEPEIQQYIFLNVCGRLVLAFSSVASTKFSSLELFLQSSLFESVSLSINLVSFDNSCCNLR